VVERLALGSESELVAAIREADGNTRRAAVERLHPHLADDVVYRTSFLEVARRAIAIQHPRIARTLEVAADDDNIYVAREYVDGVDVRTLLRSEHGIPAHVAVWLAHELLDGLVHAHAIRPIAIVHGRIVASQVILEATGGIKLIGFGAARSLRDAFDPPATSEDVRAIAAVLVELLVGRELTPVELGAPEVVLPPSVAPDLVDLLAALLACVSATAGRDLVAGWLAEHGCESPEHDVAGVVDAVRAAAVDAPVSVVPSRPPSVDLPYASISISTGPVVAEPVAVAPVAPRVYTRPSTEPRAATAPEPQVASVEPSPARPTPPLGTPSLDLNLARARGSRDDLAPPEEPRSSQTSYTSRAPRVSTHGRLHPSRAPHATTSPGRPNTPARGTRDGPPASPDFSAAYNSVVAPPAELPSFARTITPVSFDDLLEDFVAPEPVVEMPGFSTTGDLAETLPIRVVFQLAVARATGVLQMSFGAIEKHVHLHRGRPDWIGTNVVADSFERYLGSIRAVSSGELAMVLAALPQFGGKLGEALVGLGLLELAEVHRHLSCHLRDSLLEACRWKKGTYTWHPNREPLQPELPGMVDAFEVLGAAALRIDPDRIAAWTASRAGSPLVPSPTPRIDPARLRVDGLDALLDAVDGKRSVDDLAGTGASRDKRLRILLLLEVCELVVVDRG